MLPQEFIAIGAGLRVERMIRVVDFHLLRTCTQFEIMLRESDRYKLVVCGVLEECRRRTELSCVGARIDPAIGIEILIDFVSRHRSAKLDDLWEVRRKKELSNRYGIPHENEGRRTLVHGVENATALGIKTVADVGDALRVHIVAGQ